MAGVPDTIFFFMTHCLQRHQYLVYVLHLKNLAESY